MSESFLFKMFGHAALLVHGETLVLDRWRWLKDRLPRTRNAEELFDCGCGNGALTMSAATRGYVVTGISNDEMAIDRAKERAVSGLYGKQTNGLEEVWDVHKSGWDFEMLEKLLSDNNFKDIKRVEDLIKNLNIIAKKE